jgi:hypothetical protein
MIVGVPHRRVAEFINRAVEWERGQRWAAAAAALVVLVHRSGWLTLVPQDPWVAM